MKKLMTICASAMLLIACTKNDDSLPNEINQSADLTAAIYQESNIGTYKGLFTTESSSYRGSFEITIPDTEASFGYIKGNRPKATLTLSNGKIVVAYSEASITVNSPVDTILFSSNDLQFNFSVAADGSNPEATEVIFSGETSGMLTGKHTVKAPLTPIVGSYACPGCPAPLDDLAEETFSFLIGPANGLGNSQVASQTTLGNTIYNGNATQSGCVVNGSQTTCNINSGTVFGVTGTAFNPGQGPVTWVGTHTFDNGASGPDDCSTVSGTWSWASNTIGTVGGTFVSNVSGDCAPPVATLVFENFETANNATPSSGYVVRNESENTSAVEYTLAPNLDYFGRITTAEFTGGEINITNVQGSRFFGVGDIDQTGNPNGSGFDIGSINWFNLDVSSISTINASAFFAEADETGAETWDENSSVRFEYSTDNATWISFFAVEATSDLGNQAPAIDTNLNGIGDGTEINEAMVEFTSMDVDLSGINTLSVRIVFEGLNGAREDIGIDNFTISGN